MRRDFRYSAGGQVEQGQRGAVASCGNHGPPSGEYRNRYALQNCHGMFWNSKFECSRIRCPCTFRDYMYVAENAYL